MTTRVANVKNMSTSRQMFGGNSQTWPRPRRLPTGEHLVMVFMLGVPAKNHLVVKNMSWDELKFPLSEKINLFQTTNQP